MKRLIALSLGVLLVLSARARAQESPHEHHGHDHPKRTAPWDPEVLKLFQTLPVQENGRIKPLDTLAGFKLLKFRGIRSCPTPEPNSETLTPIAWLLDVLFYPDRAHEYEIFLVQDSAVLDAIGLPHETKKKRDRYSYEQLSPGFDKLMEQAKKSFMIEEAKRSPLENQIVQLAHNVMEYDNLSFYFRFAQADLPLRGSPQLDQVFAPQDRGLAVFLTKMGTIESVKAVFERSDEAGKESIRRLLQAVQQLGMGSSALTLFPSANASERDWRSTRRLLELREQKVNIDRELGFLSLWEQLEWQKKNPDAFKATLRKLHADVTALAADRGEGKKVALEVAFYKGDFFYRALMMFLGSFILVALSWIFPSKWLERGSVGLLALAAIFLVTGIVLRCIIRSRPPVSTLYETILFITAVSVIVSMIIEAINRQKIAIAVSPVLGAMGMFLAYKYEFKEATSAGDTMIELQAVLDTNFWLSTHVTTVTMGYSAGLLAAAIAHVWLLGKTFGFKKNDEKFFKTVARMTYGVLCFGLLFSTVGTILGGIWANDSWGRFWGWDPKENGALMICLWELMILHARLGGYIRDYGLCVLSILGGCVVAFSWWHVNLLGVGLHAYGFTHGVLQLLVAFYVIEGLVVLVSSGWWLAQRADAGPGATPRTEPAAT